MTAILHTIMCILGVIILSAIAVITVTVATIMVKVMLFDPKDGKANEEDRERI